MSIRKLESTTIVSLKNQNGIKVYIPYDSQVVYEL
jgi:hypothetical protein